MMLYVERQFFRSIKERRVLPVNSAFLNISLPTPTSLLCQDVRNIKKKKRLKFKAMWRSYEDNHQQTKVLINSVKIQSRRQIAIRVQQRNANCNVRGENVGPPHKCAFPGEFRNHPTGQGQRRKGGGLGRGSWLSNSIQGCGTSTVSSRSHSPLLLSLSRAEP